MARLEGRTALVTGASRGLGRAIAIALADDGARVALNYRSGEQQCREVADHISSRGGTVLVMRADVSLKDEARSLVASVLEQWGQLDILINNAGITRDNLFMRMKDEEWDQVIAVNLTAAFKLSRAALRNMMKKRWGRIVTITSVVGITGNPGQANYAAAKAGLIGMTKALAAEIASRNITVNCVAPGFIATAMTDALTQDQKAAILARIPAGRLGDSKDVAAAVVYLASEEAHYVTGQTLHVNGGMAMV